MLSVLPHLLARRHRQAGVPLRPLRLPHLPLSVLPRLRLPLTAVSVSLLMLEPQAVRQQAVRQQPPVSRQQAVRQQPPVSRQQAVRQPPLERYQTMSVSNITIILTV